MQQFSCPLCKEKYSQQNPPRLLTMCGHTFCHKCIKTLITKKKQKGFKIKCPIDKGCMQMEKPNPGLFPKNIALVDSLEKTKSSEQQQNQFLKITLSNKALKISQNQVQKLECCDLIEQIDLRQKCLLHNKSLQVYCVNQMQKICTDCALFGHHKNHEMRNLSQILRQQNSILNQIKIIIKEKQQSQKKLLDKQIQNEIIDLLDRKKSMIQQQVKQFFDDLRQNLIKRQDQIKYELQKSVFIILDRLRASMRIQENILNEYKNWQNQVSQLIELSQKYQKQHNNQSLIRNLVQNNFYEHQIQRGKQILQKIQSQQRCFIQKIEMQLHGFKFHSNTQMIQHALQNQILILKQSQNQFQNQISHLSSRLAKRQKRLSQKQAKQNHQADNLNQDEESLLDFNHNNQQPRNPLEMSPISCNNLSVLSKKSVNGNFFNDNDNQHSKKLKRNTAQKKSSGIVKKMNLSSLTEKKRAVSINFSSLGSSRSQISISGKASLNKKSSFKKIQVQSKYQNLIQDIKQNKVQNVDLTGAQLANQNLTLILSAINQSQSVKTLKLMRNKLDDQFIDKMFRCCLKVERVNLAQNKLSQACIDKIINILTKSQGIKLKYLNLGQNRIVERKNRKILQEFKKLDINIIL